MKRGGGKEGGEEEGGREEGGEEKGAEEGVEREEEREANTNIREIWCLARPVRS